MRIAQILEPVPVLVGRFLRYALRSPVHWIVFVAAPIAGVIGMQFLMEQPSVGVLVFATMLQACMLAQLSLRERELGVYRRILVAPVPELSYSIGLFAGVYLVLAAQVLIVLTAIRILPVADAAAPYPTLLILMLSFAAAAAAFGVLLTALVSTANQGAIAANVVVILSSMIGGCFWPVDIMPRYLRTVARVLPQTWVNLTVASLPDARGSIAADARLLVLYAVVFVLLFALVRRRSAE